MPPEPAPENHPLTAKPLPIIIAIIVLLIAAGGLWFILTRPTPELPGQQATSTPQGGITKETITDSGKYYDITATYPSGVAFDASADASASAHASEVMKTFATQEIARFKDNNNLEHLTAADIQTLGLSDTRKYALEIDYDVYTSPATVSYVYHMYDDSLGAHPNAYYRTFTFDRKTGEGLLLDDIFSPTADYLSVLSNQARTRLPKIIEDYSGYPPDTGMLNAGTSPDADNFLNFYLDTNDLVVIFPPYQVGPYALGTQLLRIPRSELGNTLKAEYR